MKITVIVFRDSGIATVSGNTVESRKAVELLKSHPDYVTSHEITNPETSRYSCCKCDLPEPFGYMVTDEVWKEAGLEKNQIVCLSCLETKCLHRPLTVQDIPWNVPLNSPILVGLKISRQSK